MIRNLLLAVSGGLLLAFASSAIPGRAQAVYSEIMGCEQGCDVAAAGWPVAYLVDYPGISVVGSADLSGAAVGEDHLRLGAFGLTLLFWMLTAATALCAAQRLFRHRRR